MTGRPTNGECVTISNNKRARTQVTVRVWPLRDDRIVVEEAILTVHLLLVERLNFGVTFTFHVFFLFYNIFFS